MTLELVRYDLYTPILVSNSCNPWVPTEALVVQKVEKAVPSPADHSLLWRLLTELRGSMQASERRFLSLSMTLLLTSTSIKSPSGKKKRLFALQQHTTSVHERHLGHIYRRPSSHCTYLINDGVETTSTEWVQVLLCSQLPHRPYAGRMESLQVTH